jgi:UDP-N-acetylmuramate dehydrogenase
MELLQGPIFQMTNQNLKILLPRVRENVGLARYTTFNIGGPAKYFFVAKTKQDLIKAIKIAKQNNLRFFILGGGSNLLVNDKGYDGLVINFQFSIFNFHGRPQADSPKGCFSKINAGAGTLLSEVVQQSVENGLTGLEWAVGIPGTIGGAIYGNAGGSINGNRVSIGDFVESVEILDKNLKIKKYTKKQCKFAYRESIFKHNNEIILSVVLKLKKGNSEKNKEIIKQIFKERTQKIPKGYSAGCIFKNSDKYSAGYLIDECGLKGKKIGRAEISKKHSNFIINLGNAQANDVLKLIKLVKQKVRQKFKISLEEEIQLI